MFRMLLTTTAIVAVLQTGALAADTKATDTMKPGPVFSQDGKYESRVTQDGYYQFGTDQILANSLIGKSVYNNATDDAEAVGDINDIVISPNGTAEAVIIGVGGFLGIGEKDVAVDFDKVSWADRNGERWIIVDATKEQLEAAPAYERVAMSEKPMDRSNATTTEKMATNAPATERSAQNTADQEMMPVDIAAMSTDELIGARVYDAQQEDMGEISDVIVSDSGSVEAFIVDVGGFLGIGEKPVAIGAKNLDFKKNSDEDILVFTPFSKKQLNDQAAYTKEGFEKDPVNGVLVVPNS